MPPSRAPRDVSVDAPIAGLQDAAGGTASPLGGLADAKVELVHGPLAPYLMCGAGAHNVRTELNGANGTSESRTRFGINGGAGLRARLGPVSAFLQGRLDNVFRGKGTLQARNLQVIPVTAGIEY